MVVEEEEEERVWGVGVGVLHRPEASRQPESLLPFPFYLEQLQACTRDYNNGIMGWQ